MMFVHDLPADLRKLESLNIKYCNCITDADIGSISGWHLFGFLLCSNIAISVQYFLSKIPLLRETIFEEKRISMHYLFRHSSDAQIFHAAVCILY